MKLALVREVSRKYAEQIVSLHESNRISRSERGMSINSAFKIEDSIYHLPFSNEEGHICTQNPLTLCCPERSMVQGFNSIKQVVDNP